ncbi:hypothetical protein ACPXB3_16755 [Gordonia sp. DT219]|uniref:hypothetical protein n=1 Tax=Gordonia sp. DT219 TaxID=3416658 RepID=UPI003CF3F88F
MSAATRSQSRQNVGLRRGTGPALAPGEVEQMLVLGLLELQCARDAGDGLVRATGITLTDDEIGELATLADAANVNTRGSWEHAM